MGVDLMARRLNALADKPRRKRRKAACEEPAPWLATLPPELARTIAQVSANSTALHEQLARVSVYRCWECVDRPDAAAFVTGIASDGMVVMDCGHERPALTEYEGLGL